jgi:threonine aldolase
MGNNSRGFASDNNAGVHPRILQAIESVNKGHTIAYGDDPYTAEAKEIFQKHFGKNIDVYFVFNGTAANVLGIKAITESYHSIICSDLAHLHMDECGAPEKYTGCKILTVESSDGKLTIEGIRRHMHGFGFEHHAQPKVISITQSTEMGRVYTVSEIREIADYAHDQGLYLHMDGARIANAAAKLSCTLKQMTVNAGVDVLSFGGTKNGMMFGEAIVFFHPNISKEFKYIRKQGMQLGSKMRFISAQFSALLSNDLWLDNACHANKMAKYLEEKVRKISQIQITQPIEVNAIFAILPEQHIETIQNEFFFYVWNEDNSEVRWMTAFDTEKEDIDKFTSFIEKTVSGT